MTEKTLFISSCSRRQLARRRAGRGAWRANVLSVALATAAALVVLVVVRGGL